MISINRRDNGVNQYLSWTPPSAAINYESNGNLTQEGNINASFNALNQPISISSSAVPSGISFAFDPLGRCVKRTNGGSTYSYYDGWSLIQEGPNSATARSDYAHGNRIDEIVASQAGGAWYYHHYDARGHCILVTNASGSLVEQYDYNAFGKPYFYNGTGTSLPNGSAIGNRFLFTGREWLSGINVYDFRNRHYLPELGRFIQPDPKQFEAGDYNLYRYCHNDPVNKSDPTGEILDTLLDVGFIGYDVYRLISDGGGAENWKALGLDAAAAAIPFATGAGAAYRGAKALERANEAAGALRAGTHSPKGGTGNPALKKDPYSPGEVSKRQSETRRQLDTGNRDPDSSIPDQGPGRNIKGSHEAKKIEAHGTRERNVGTHEEHSRVDKGPRRPDRYE
jgi:RHS repeat-associated protein